MDYANRPQNKSFGSNVKAKETSRETQDKQYQERIEAYNLNPKCCKECEKIIPYGHKASHKRKIFCDRSCAAKYNNKNSKPGRKFGPAKINLVRKKYPQKSRSKGIMPSRAKPGTVIKIIKMCKCCGLVKPPKACQYCKDCQPNISLYRARASFTFNVYMYPEEFNLSLVEQYGWYSPNGHKGRNKTPNLDGVSRDHLYSVSEGFKNKKDPTILAHPANCQIMIHNGKNGNSSKKHNSSITWEELLIRIEEWDSKYI